MKLLVELDWTLQAACRSEDPETFFPTKQGMDHPEVKEALAVCAPCPVRQTCLEYALDHERTNTTYRFGIYGGLTPLQRNALVHPHKERPQRLSPEVLEFARNSPSVVVRAWARKQRLAVSDSGVLPTAVRRAYAVAMFADQEAAS